MPDNGNIQQTLSSFADQQCCIAYVFAHNTGVIHFAVGDGSTYDQQYHDCLANPSQYGCGQSANTTSGTSNSSGSGSSSTNPNDPNNPFFPIGSGNVNTGLPVIGVPSQTNAQGQDTCPAFSLSDPGPALQCFAFTTLRYLMVNLAAAGVFAFGLKLAFEPEFRALAQNVKQTVKTVGEAGAAA